MTLLWAIILFAFLPDSPQNARFLNDRDRIKAILRVKSNMTGIKDQNWKRDQVIEALSDPKSWLIVIIALACNIPNGGITSVSPGSYLRRVPYN